MPDIIGRRRPGLAYFYDGFINMPEYYNCRLVISFIVEFFAIFRNNEPGLCIDIS